MSASPSPSPDCSNGNHIETTEEMEFKLNQATDLEGLFQDFLKQIDNDTIVTKEKIDEKIKIIQNELIQRQNTLHEQIDEWKKIKTETINDEISNITQYQKSINQVENDSDDDDDEDDEDADDKYSQYQTSSDLMEYMKDNLQSIDIDFGNKLMINDIGSFGKIVDNDRSNTEEIPSIILENPIRCKESKNGYRVKLKWKTTKPINLCIYDEDDEFIIKCCKQKKRSYFHDDDEKQNEAPKWKLLKYNSKSLKFMDNEYYIDNIYNTFLFDTTYNFKIEYVTNNPIHLVIGSNICPFMVEGRRQIIKPPSGDAHKIELSVFLQNGHHEDVELSHPRNLLVRNKSCYASAKKNKLSKNNKDDYVDWIIFEMMSKKKNIAHFPKRFVIRNNESSTGIREMKISIGDVEQNAWFDFLPKKINIKKGNGYNYQSFNINGVDYEIIKKYNLKYIKLTFTKNHGASSSAWCAYCFYEFSIYGIPY